MPDSHVLIERDHGDSGLLAYLDPRPLVYPTVAEVAVNPYGAPTAQNAAGTQDDLAMHVAFIVAFAAIGVWALRASNFKFVVAGSVG